MFERAYIHKSIGLSVIHLPEKEIPIGVETFTTGWEERQKTDQVRSCSPSRHCEWRTPRAP